MKDSTLNLSLLIIFLLINFVIGIKSSRGVKTMRDYVLGGKSFGVIALTLTLLASDIGGTAILYGTQNLFSEGLISFFSETIPIILCIGVALVIVPKFINLSHCLTIGDIMKSCYNKYVGIITGLFGAIHSICVAGMEFLILKQVFSSILHIDSIWVIIVIGLSIAITTAIGGIKSVTSGDVFKFIIMALGIPVIAYMLVTKVGGTIEIFKRLPEDKVNVFSNPSLIKDLPDILLFGIVPFCLTCPFVIQRILMARKKDDVKNMFLIYGISYPLLSGTLMLIAFSVLVVNPTLAADQVLPYAINELLPSGLRGIAILAIISVIISSIDSYLQIAGVTVIHDIVLPFMTAEKQSSINELKWCRIITFFISFLAILIGLKAKDAVELLVATFCFTGPITLFPIILGIMGVKVDTKSYFYAATSTLTAYLYTTFFLPAEYSNYTLLIHLAANGIVFFSSLLIQNGGRIVFREEYVNKRNGNDDNFSKKLSKLLTFPLHIAEFSRKKVEKYGASYALFAGFCLINYVLPFFLWTAGESLYSTEILWMRFIGGVLVCLLLVHEKWPVSFKKYLPLFWHFVLAYTLAFTNTIMFLSTRGSIEWLINVAISILFLIALVDWVSFFVIAFVGVASGFFVFHHFIGGDISIGLSFSTKYLLLYQILFATIIGLLFARRKQKRTKPQCDVKPS